jgi:hypothetical protein
MMGLILAVASFAGCVLAQDRTAEFRSRFDHEPDPVRKAMLIVPLGDAEFLEIQKEFEAGEISEALAVLRQYRDEVRSCRDGLDARGIDAERHPSGFKQLQISLRESLRRLDDLIVSIPRDQQTPFLDVRKEIDQMNRHVIRELFPRQPDSENETAKKRG